MVFDRFWLLSSKKIFFKKFQSLYNVKKNFQQLCTLPTFWSLHSFQPKNAKNPFFLWFFGFLGWKEWSDRKVRKVKSFWKFFFTLCRLWNFLKKFFFDEMGQQLGVTPPRYISGIDLRGVTFIKKNFFLIISDQFRSKAGQK